MGCGGLYSVSARTSGLIAEGALDVTEETRAFLERNGLDRLGGAEPPLLRLLARGGTLDTRKKDPVFSALADVLTPAFNTDEVDFYGRRLRDGRAVHGAAPERQGRFRALLEAETDLDAPVGRPELLGLVKAAARVDEELAGRLERIAHLEALLAPAEALFQHILARHGQPVDDVATVISSHWGPRIPHLDRLACTGRRSDTGDLGAIGRGHHQSDRRLSRRVGPWRLRRCDQVAGRVEQRSDGNARCRPVGAAGRPTPARCALSGH